VISTGGIVAFRTDTFYGLGGDPFNTLAIERIKRLKGREDNKPILVIISNPEELTRFIHESSATFKLLAGKFWPGPLTIVGPARSDLPGDLTAHTGTIGLRLPNDRDVCELVRACGGALTATSANPADKPPARTAQEVESYFSEGIDLIVDGGPARTDQPSTVVDATQAEPRLVREGVITWAAILSAIDSR